MDGGIGWALGVGRTGGPQATRRSGLGRDRTAVVAYWSGTQFVGEAEELVYASGDRLGHGGGT